MAKKKSSGGVVETIKTVVYALLLAGLIRTLLFQPFWIPSGSMKSTLLIGDFMFVNKMAYGYSYASCPSMFGVDFCGFAKGQENRLWGEDPEIGDVVVFKHPATGEDYIKRLIAGPGDTVEVRDGVLFLNGEEAVQTELPNFVETFDYQGSQRNLPACANSVPPLGGDCIKQARMEVLPNGVDHTVLNIRTSRTDNFGPTTVPEGHFFFMGDNRDNSLDSRVTQLGGGVGFVPRENIIGRADRIMFSSAGRSLLMFWTWRSDRFFKAIE